MSVHEFPSCDVKVYSSHEIHDTENAVADTVMDLNDGVFRFGVMESYDGVDSLNDFKDALSLLHADETFWLDHEFLGYAIVEINDYDIDFYHAGDCEIFIKFNGAWLDLYDLIIEGSVLSDVEHFNGLLGDATELTSRNVSEIILATSNSGVTVDDLNDRITEDHNFMTNVSFDETNDVRLVHIKFG